MSAPNTPKRNSANGGKPKVAHAPSKKSRKPIPKDKVYVKKEVEDILMGRGGESNGHPGNQWYLDEVQLLAPAYGKASKIEKTNISESVLQMVSQRGGRFIQKEEDIDLWFIAHEKAARDKASQALREAYKRLQGEDADVGAMSEEAVFHPAESTVSDAELAELCNGEGGNIFDDLDVMSEGTGSLALASSTSIDESSEHHDETRNGDDSPYEGVVTQSQDGHVYENCEVTAKRAPPRDEDEEDGSFANV